MSNPVLTSDLAARWRPLTPAETPVAEALLQDAWALLLAAVPNLEERRTSRAVSDDLVVYVVTAMVLRVLRNPDGIRQWSVDDASFTRDQALSAGGLYVSEVESALLAGTPGGSSASGAVSFSAPYGRGW